MPSPRARPAAQTPIVAHPNPRTPAKSMRTLGAPTHAAPPQVSRSPLRRRSNSSPTSSRRPPRRCASAVWSCARCSWVARRVRRPACRNHACLPRGDTGPRLSLNRLSTRGLFLAAGVLLGDQLADRLHLRGNAPTKSQAHTPSPSRPTAALATPAGHAPLHVAVATEQVLADRGGACCWAQCVRAAARYVHR